MKVGGAHPTRPYFPVGYAPRTHIPRIRKRYAIRTLPGYVLCRFHRRFSGGRCRLKVQNHQLIRAQSNGFVSTSFTVTEFDLEGLSIGQDVNHGADLAAMQAIFRKAGGQRDYVQQMKGCLLYTSRCV